LGEGDQAQGNVKVISVEVVPLSTIRKVPYLQHDFVV
jgi:hypothetical protein